MFCLVSWCALAFGEAVGLEVAGQRGERRKAAADVPVIVGVLEEPQCKPEIKVAVRALFAKPGRSWVALPESSGQALDLSRTWTVVLDGRPQGSVATSAKPFEGTDAWTYRRDHLLTVAPDEIVPMAPNDQGLFRGWCDAPANRPLVVLARRSFRDPAGWKPVTLAPGYRRTLLGELKANAGEALVCPSREGSPVAFQYSAEDLVLHRGYRDRAGRRLVSIGLDPTKDTCDGLIGALWRENWFLLANGRTTYLGDGLSLVDVGDYDNDGHSEVLFWYSGYNEDGYVLFHDEFRQRVEYLWSYH